jgi:hypothetical protein
VNVGYGYAIFLQEVKRLRLFGKIMGIKPEANLARLDGIRNLPFSKKAQSH